MADVEALGDVDGGIIEAHRLALAHLGGAPAARVGQHGLHDALGQAAAADEDVHIAAHDLDAVDLLAAHLFRQRGGDHLRRLAQRLGQAEARQRIVAQLLVRRRLEHGRHIGHGQGAVFKARLRRVCDAAGDDLFHIHLKGSPFIPILQF